MPAMSPTMTEGGVAQWKKQEGEAFSAGDVLLEIVRRGYSGMARDGAHTFWSGNGQGYDRRRGSGRWYSWENLGAMDSTVVVRDTDSHCTRIQARDGTKNIPVGKVIALLAEEGDDILNLQPPVEEAKPEPTPKPASSEPAIPKSEPAPTPSTSTPSHSHKPIEHSRPLFPSVLRLLQEHNVDSVDKIKGTGIRGMLTKGDILAHLGLASGPTGTFKEKHGLDEHTTNPAQKSEVEPPLDGPAIRRLIVSNMLAASTRARSGPGIDLFYALFPNAEPDSQIIATTGTPDFDSIIADYLPPAPRPPAIKDSSVPPKPSQPDYFEGLL